MLTGVTSVVLVDVRSNAADFGQLELGLAVVAFEAALGVGVLLARDVLQRLDLSASDR